MGWTTTLLFAWLSGHALAATGPSTGDTGGTGDTSAPAGTGDTGLPGGTGDTGLDDTGLDVDLDGDGWTPREGDCDDADEDESPGLVEVCFDELDNDCDGLYDQECDGAAQLASLRGGGGCTGGSGVGGTTSAMFLAPLLVAAWSGTRRRNAERQVR